MAFGYMEKGFFRYRVADIPAPVLAPIPWLPNPERCQYHHVIAVAAWRPGLIVREQFREAWQGWRVLFGYRWTGFLAGET